MDSTQDFVTQKEAESLTGEGKYRQLVDEAVGEFSEVLKLEDVEEIHLNLFEDNEAGAGDYSEDRTVNINENPEMSSHPEHRNNTEVQGEAAYEEVMHILTTQDAYRERHGERRKTKHEFDFWEATANEMLGGMSRWGEKWSLESSLEKAEGDIPEIERGINPNFAVQVLTHFIGYSLSKNANQEGHEPSELARMSYGEIREEFDEDIQEIRRGLADNHGIYVDLDGSISQRQDLEDTPDNELEEKEPSIYVEEGDGVYGFGTFDYEHHNPDNSKWVRKWHPFPEGVPEEAKPEI